MILVGEQDRFRRMSFDQLCTEMKAALLRVYKRPLSGCGMATRSDTTRHEIERHLDGNKKSVRSLNQFEDMDLDKRLMHVEFRQGHNGYCRVDYTYLSGWIPPSYVRVENSRKRKLCLGSH